MTTGIEFLKPEKKRMGRGLGKKPALAHISLRITKETAAYLKSRYPDTTQETVRDLLADWVKRQIERGN